MSGEGKAVKSDLGFGRGTVADDDYRGRHFIPGIAQLPQKLPAGIGEGARVVDRLPLGRLAAAIARLHGCIGLDTGITHVAATLGLPTVQLFIEDKAWRAAAYWEPKTAVLQASESALPTVAQTMAAWRSVA